MQLSREVILRDPEVKQKRWLHSGHRLKIQITQIGILFPVLCSLFSVSYAQSPKYVRVAIIKDAESLSLKVRGSYEIVDSSRKKILDQGKNLKTTVTAYKDGILIGGRNFNHDKIFIQTRKGKSIVLNGRKFTGDIQFIKKDNLHLSAINFVDLEDYIKGILYHEVSHYWPLEALKAQAIICRSYALYQIQENRAKDYDVTSDIYSQVYGGETSQRYRTNKAVDTTKYKVLTYQDNIFPTYYHATCGGHTEDVSLLWDIDILPLKGVTCDFCKNSPHFKWDEVLPLDKIKDALIKAGYSGLGDIKDIEILGRDKSSRIADLRIVTEEKALKISAKDFRNILGPNIIRSTNFNIKVVNGDSVFQGDGWGHGVGLCQWGAYFMAKQGYTYQEILEYYYPQADVTLIVI